MSLALCGGMHFTIDGFRIVYVVVAIFMWLMTLLFSPEYMRHHENKLRYYIFMILTAFATIGVFLGKDLYTIFIFFEIMSFTSYVWVAQEETDAALEAAKTYLAVAVIGGLVMLMGIFLMYNTSYTFAAGLCLLFGFGAKAGAFPLHIWLPKAHPVAPAPASALLSGILTKTGVFGILYVTTNYFMTNVLWSNIILYIGVITMFLGALLALFSIDLKRTLACSSMSQIGFILTGIGVGAFEGAFLHMINHSLIKLLLFMVAGAIYMKTHALDLNKIQGYGRKKPFLHVLYLVGGLTIMGIPGFGGYISKTLIHEGLVEYGDKLLEWIFLISGGMTICYITKLYIAIFVQKNKKEGQQEIFDKVFSMNWVSACSLGLSALVLFIWGRTKIMTSVSVFAHDFLKIEGEEIFEINFFSFENLKGALISISIGACLYALVYYKAKFMELKKKKMYTNIWPELLDLEKLFYKPILLTVLPTFCGLVCRIFDSLVDGIVVLLRKTIYRDSTLPHIRNMSSAFFENSGKFVNAFNRFKYSFLMWQGFDNVVKQSTRNKAKLKLETDYELSFNLAHENRKEDMMIIGRSLSFGLMMFCLGLMLALIYVILL